MNNHNNTSLSQSNPHFSMPSIWFSSVILLVGIADAFLWGMYWETKQIIKVNPLGTELLSYHLGMLAYSLLALFFLCLSAHLLYKSITTGQWMGIHRDLYLINIFLSIIYVITAFEFLFWQEWEHWNPIPYILCKGIFAGLLVVFIIRVMRIQWKKIDEEVNPQSCSPPISTIKDDGCD